MIIHQLSTAHNRHRNLFNEPYSGRESFDSTNKVGLKLMKKKKTKSMNYLNLRRNLGIRILIRAIEEDMMKEEIQCWNTYCNKSKSKSPTEPEWKQQTILGQKVWLCENCYKAYNKQQFCEFCGQIYLESTSEFSTLDGKEWAQCEGSQECGRWGHVECLSKHHGISYSTVISNNFHYLCSNCKVLKKRKPRMISHENSKKKCLDY